MRWATRAGVHVDRAACAWLLRRFVDPDAEFVFVDDPDDVPADATPFDMRGVELSHHEGDCTFETMLRRFELDDPVLWDVARIVHEADLADDRFDAPEACGLDVICRGLSMVLGDGEVLAVTADLRRPLRAPPPGAAAREGPGVIVCLRTVEVPAAASGTSTWTGSTTAAGPRGPRHPGRAGARAASGEGDSVVITVWPDHEVFDAWIATPERDALPPPRSTRRSTTGPSPVTTSSAATSTCPASSSRAFPEEAHMKMGHPCPPEDRPHRLPLADPTVHRPRRGDPLRAHRRRPRRRPRPGRRTASTRRAPSSTTAAARCTFEVLIDHFDLGDRPGAGAPGRHRARRRHRRASSTPTRSARSAGHRAGRLDVEADDHRLLERASFVYDALYAWCRAAGRGGAA